MNSHIKHDILCLIALTIGILMIILLSGCRPTRFSTDNTETRDSIGQIQQTRDSILVKVLISVKMLNDTVIDGICHERFCHLTIREAVQQTQDTVQDRTIAQKEAEESTPWYSKGCIFAVLLVFFMFPIFI